MIKKSFFVFLVIILQLFAKEILIASTVQYISPLPNSKFNSELTNIIIGYSEKLSNETKNSIRLVVRGSSSGLHTGEIIFAEKNTKVLFKSDKPFAFGEKVTVSGIKGTDDFSFYIREIKPVLSENFYRNLSLDGEINNFSFSGDYKGSPDSLPAFTIYNSGNTADGYIFIVNFGPTTPSTLMILKNNGTPYFYRSLTNYGFDFKKQNDNLATYFNEIGQKFFGINKFHNVVDSFFCGNGYNTNFHECRVLLDGSAWLMSYDPQYVNMSIYVPGGNTNALVAGLIIQKIDAQKNVVFQWKSWDHFQITDATHENFLATYIDYVHGNSIEIDYDDNIMISCRHMDEITKINTMTGDIMWRLGGKNNQFAFINDTIGFSHQHSINRLKNENILLFDNGNYHTPQFSRVIEYNIDENSKTVNLVWQYRRTPSIYASAMGSVQRLDNGNTLIGWGSAAKTLTEVKYDGTIVYELSLPAGQTSYRAFRFEWGTTTNTQNNKDILPLEYKLYQNYPNPFNPVTNIKYQIPNKCFVALKIYDILGKELTALVNEMQSAGTYEIGWDASQYSSGIYFYKVQTENFSEVKKMVLIK